MFSPRFPDVPLVPVQQIDDDELLDMAERLGACKIIAERRFLALLPEIDRRKLYKRAPVENPYLSPGASW